MEPYLQVTYRHGRALAAYYYLPRPQGDRSVRTQECESGLLVDYDSAGHPIGVEITAPGRTSLAALNRVLRGLGVRPMTRTEFAPLRAA